MLLNKKVLIFVPGGDGIYGHEIKTAVESKGALVQIYDERPSSSTIGKIFTRLVKKVTDVPFNEYLRSVVQGNNVKEYDYILIVRGEAFRPTSVGVLRRAYPRAKIILFLWDSIANTDVREIIDCVDVAYSYDPEDVSRYNSLKYCPTFYLDQYRDLPVSISGDIDLLFSGTVHSDRYNVVQRVRRNLRSFSLNMYCYYYFPSRLLYCMRYIEDKEIRVEPISNIKFNMLGVQKMAGLVAASRVILDVQHPKQSGLTLRPVEMLGARRKLITTNQNIRIYDFYDENNILIVDRENPKINSEFFSLPYRDIDKVIYDKYSIHAWVKRIFSCN